MLRLIPCRHLVFRAWLQELQAVEDFEADLVLRPEEQNPAAVGVADFFLVIRATIWGMLIFA